MKINTKLTEISGCSKRKQYSTQTMCILFCVYFETHQRTKVVYYEINRSKVSTWLIHSRIHGISMRFKVNSFQIATPKCKSKEKLLDIKTNF